MARNTHDEKQGDAKRKLKIKTKSNESPKSERNQDGPVSIERELNSADRRAASSDSRSAPELRAMAGSAKREIPATPVRCFGC